MFRKRLSAMLAAAVLALTGSVLSADALDTQPREMTEREALEIVCAELGIEDYDAYLTELAARIQSSTDRNGTRDTCPYSSEYYIDIYTSGSSNGRIDAMDANYLLQYLNGQVNYPYNNYDLDPNEDYIIDRGDVAALLECFSAVYILGMYPNFVPGTHGALSTPEAVRSYRRFDWNTQTEDSTLYAVPLPSSSMTSTSASDALQQSNTRQTFFDCTDSRIICTNGSGFIVGEHVIATNAHCLVNDYGLFNSHNPATLLTYPTNDPHSPVYTPLTIVSLHVPDNYLKKDANGNIQYYNNTNIPQKDDNYDYGLIVVEESLSQYGSFDLGLVLQGISSETPLTLMSFPQNNDPNNNSNMNGSVRVRPLTSYGQIGQLNGGLLTHSCDSWFGSSGGALFTNLPYGSVSFETLIGIHRAHYRGVRITQPVMLFYLNNPKVTQDLEVIT